MTTTSELPVPKEYSISDLFGMAWEAAILYAASKFGISKRSAFDNWVEVEKKANKKGLRFDMNGDPINKEE